MIFLVLSMLATVLTLIIGMILMATDGKIYNKYKNKIMVARIIFQAISIILLVIIFKK